MNLVDTETPSGDTVEVGKPQKVKHSAGCRASSIRQRALEKPLVDHSYLVPLCIIRDYAVRACNSQD